MEPTRAAPCFADARRIDLLCDDFEARWTAGERPRLEGFVESLPESLRSDGLRALLAIELELLAREGRLPSPDEYQTRWSGHQGLVAEVFAQMRQAADKDTTSPGIATDTGSFPEQPASESAAPEPMPARVGRFEILAVLGEGAYGTVYRARDPQLDREVAVKVPKVAALGSDFDPKRFLRKAKTAARLRHPNICPVYEVGMDNQRLFIVMAFVEGVTLADHFKARKSPMPPRQIAKLVQRLALALQAAHDKGIVHRDLKPGNVLIDRERSDVVVTDFGLARLAQRESSAVQTQSGVIMGTPAYMAPEQARGDVRSIGPHTDIYSLGVVLYERLCGRRPFNGTVGEVIGQIIHVEPEPPSKVRPEADPRLEAICLKAMAKDPTVRYASMRELGDALGEYLRGEAPASEPTPAPAASRATASAPPPALQEVVEDLVAGPPASVEVGAESSAPAAVQGARRRLWSWLVAVGLLGLLVLGGVVFFFPTPTVQVVININNFGVDANDRSLAFFLDGQPISAEALKAPIELKVGSHELMVKRGDDILHRFTFGVSRNATRIEMKEETLSQPQERDKSVPPGKVKGSEDTPFKPPDEWVSLFNGKDLTGWNVADEDGTHIEPAKSPWKVRDGEVFFSLPEGTIERFNLTSEREYADFRLRFEFQADDKIRAGVRIRAVKDANQGQGSGMVWIGDTFPFLKTSYFMYAPQSKQHLVPDSPPQLRPAGEWNVMQIDAQGQRQQVFINGQKVLDFDREELSKRPLALPGLTRPQGVIRFLGTAGAMRLRKIAVKEYRALPSGDPGRAAAEFLLNNGAIVAGTADGKPFSLNAVNAVPPGRVEIHYIGAGPNGSPTLTDETLAAHAAGLTKLQRIDGNDMKLAGTGFAAFRQSELKALDMHTGSITDAGLEAVSRIATIEELAFPKNRITDAGLKHLRKLPKLWNLDLRGNQITDAGMAELAKCTNLGDLGLDATAITDVGLEKLKACTRLHGLHVQGTKVTLAGVDKLRKALPKCQIFSPFGTFDPKP